MEILIIKLGAMGDVLRTTPLLPALKEKFSSGRITWLVDRASAKVLERNPCIDALVVLTNKSMSELTKKRFDLAVNLDKEPEALEAIMTVSAGRKMGFGKSPSGELKALDAASDYAYRLGIDDTLKFRVNQKSYQEITFEQLGLRFDGEEYHLAVSQSDRRIVKDYLKQIGWQEGQGKGPVIGLNTGSGRRFAGKKLPLETYLELIRLFFERLSATVFLLGGHDEIERNRQIQQRSPYPAFNTGVHPIKQFAAIVEHCDLVVSGDTIAMHIAIAMKVPIVAFFASTCAAEIELYGRGRKVVSTIECAPCYLRDCPIDEKCMKHMDAEEIFRVSKEVLDSAGIHENHLSR